MSDWERERQARDEARRREVLALPTAAFARHTTLEPLHETDQLVTASIGPDGDIYALWSSPGDADQLAARAVQPSWAARQMTRTAKPVGALVTAHAPDRRLVARINDLELAHPKVQPLPDNRVLIVGARAGWRPDGPDLNAIVVGADGRRIHQGTLGDGVKNIQATPAGDIWVGYSDEGVYGNLGWNRPGPTPIGRSGIVRFDSDLTRRWEFPGQLHQPWGGISDCYAMNVVGEIAWAYYYTEFPVVRIDDGQLSGWHNTVHGARALAVGDGGRILLAGGYGADHHRLIEGRLAGGELVVSRESRLTLPTGADLPPDAVITGRDRHLFVFSDRDCYRMTFAE